MIYLMNINIEITINPSYIRRYMNVHDKSSLCANRSGKSMICSICKDGCSQSMNSTQCSKCEEDIDWKYLFYPSINSIIQRTHVYNWKIEWLG